MARIFCPIIFLPITLWFDDQSKPDSGALKNNGIDRSSFDRSSLTSELGGDILQLVGRCSA
jgi:hypothetical protein